MAREGVADEHYKGEFEYRKSQDELARQQNSRDFGLREKVANAQLRNADYELQLKQDEAKREAALRKNTAFQYLLKYGTDAGKLAPYLNAETQPQGWLKTRNLDGAQIDELRLNDMGKGEPGVVTFIKGKDKQTGQERRGVATKNASSDPNDPVEVMPLPAVAELGKRYADEAEAAGDVEGAHLTRKELLRFLEAQSISLGGQAPAPGYSEVRNDPVFGPHQVDLSNNKITQIKTGRGYGVPSRNGFGSGGSGGSGENARLSQVYRQMSDAFPDDAERQIDNSVVRNLATSLAQDFDKRSGGGLAQGIYVQAASEASQGLALSRGAAEQQAIKELNQGKYIGSVDAEDEKVQVRAAEIIHDNKLQFADNYTEALEKMAGYRQGFASANSGQQPPAATTGAQPAPASLDDAVKLMVDGAKSKGVSFSPEQAREYLLSKYPDRFGSQVADEPSAEPTPEQQRPRKWGEIADNSIDKRLVGGIKQGVQKHAEFVRGASDAAVSGLQQAKQYGAREVARNRFSKALTMGHKPSARDLLDWLPHLDGADQEQALALLDELYPGALTIRQGLRKND